MHDMRNVVLVSPYFPPSTLAGVHRARHLARHLPHFGWRPTVVCVDPRHLVERPDPQLASMLPRELDIVRSAAVPAAATRLLGFGDIGLRAFVPLGRAIDTILCSRPVDAVLITGGPFYPMLHARRISRTRNVPVVLDFQDPWVSDWGAHQPRASKAGMAHALARWLEPHVVRAADFVTSVSDEQNAQMRRRYSWLDAQRMEAIPIGGDPEDFEILRRQPLTTPVLKLTEDRLTLSYVGTCLPRALPLMECILGAVRHVRNVAPALAERLRLEFVGTSNQTVFEGAPLVQPVAERLGVGDLVRETPQRIPYIDALNVLANSHALLLVGSDEPHYTASKIYPALISGRPTISLFDRRSSAHDILVRAGGGRPFAFDDVGELPSLQTQIADAMIDILGKPQALQHADPDVIDACGARAVAGRFAAIFDSLRRVTKQ